eukprot:scaffold7798_cov630-Pinguiococcus_pyrenoidosus.AAC.1
MTDIWALKKTKRLDTFAGHFSDPRIFQRFKKAVRSAGNVKKGNILLSITLTTRDIHPTPRYTDAERTADIAKIFSILLAAPSETSRASQEKRRALDCLSDHFCSDGEFRKQILELFWGNEDMSELVMESLLDRTRASERCWRTLQEKVLARSDGLVLQSAIKVVKRACDTELTARLIDLRGRRA